MRKSRRSWVATWKNGPSSSSASPTCGSPSRLRPGSSGSSRPPGLERLSPGVAAPAALHVGAEVEDEGEDDDEPLEALDPVRAGAPHHRVGERRPRQQEEAEKGDEPAL